MRALRKTLAYFAVKGYEITSPPAPLLKRRGVKLRLGTLRNTACFNWSGFAAGAFSSAAGSLVQGFQLADKIGTVGMVGVGALSGGLAAELSGGDFGLGAISGAWVVLFNHMQPHMENAFKKVFNIDKALKWLNENAYSTSQKRCAEFVRKALEAGGLDTQGRPNYAKDYVDFLVKKGFTIINTTDFKAGDIAVFSTYPGNNMGHIQMYNGSQWVSDFKQFDFWPGPGYRQYKPNYTILRWEQ